MHTKRSDSDDLEGVSLLVGRVTKHEETTQRWWKVLLPILTVSHVLFTLFGYGLGRYCASDRDRNGPISRWTSNLDRSFHTARFNPFEQPNNFTAHPDDGGQYTEDRWIDLGGYGENLPV
jgi:hypothetical protein